MTTIKKRITIYTQYYKPVANACSNRAEKFVLALKDDYEVKVVTGIPNYPTGIKPKKYQWKLFKKEKGDHGEEIIRTYEFASKNEGALLRTLNYMSFLLSSLIFGIFSRKTDIIIVTSPPIFTAISVLWIHKIRRIPYIVDVRDLWPESVVALGYMKRESSSYKLFNYLEKKIYKNAQSIIAVTKGIQDYIKQVELSDKKMILQYNISDKIQANDNVNPYKEYKKTIDGRKVSLFAGNMNEAYDFQATAKNIKEKKDIFFVFIGDGSEKAKFQKNLSTLDNVMFLDRMPQSELESFIYYCDIVLVPLKDEPFYKGTFPVKGIEGIVNGKEILFLGPLDGEFNNYLTQMREGKVNTDILEFEGFQNNIKQLLP